MLICVGAGLCLLFAISVSARGFRFFNVFVLPSPLCLWVSLRTLLESVSWNSLSYNCYFIGAMSIDGCDLLRRVFNNLMIKCQLFSGPKFLGSAGCQKHFSLLFPPPFS